MLTTLLYSCVSLLGTGCTSDSCYFSLQKKKNNLFILRSLLCNHWLRARFATGHSAKASASQFVCNAKCASSDALHQHHLSASVRQRWIPIWMFPRGLSSTSYSTWRNVKKTRGCGINGKAMTPNKLLLSLYHQWCISAPYCENVPIVCTLAWTVVMGRSTLLPQLPNKRRLFRLMN